MVLLPNSPRGGAKEEDLEDIVDIQQYCQAQDMKVII